MDEAGRRMMDSAPKISVIIPVYEVTDYLQQAIDSVLSQAYPAIEIIVVDDGSSPQAAAHIDTIAKKTNITVVRQANSGPAIARKNGVHAAHGEYIIFLDADDFLFPGSIVHLAQTLQKNPDAIAAYGRKTFIDADEGFGQKQVMPTERQMVSGNLLPALLKGVPLLSNGSICIRRNALEDTMFPENIRQGEDWVTWCRLALTGNIVYAGDRVVVCIRKHADNLSVKALHNPALLSDMLPAVFDDPRIEERVGEMMLFACRAQHMQAIHGYVYIHGPLGKTSALRKKALFMPPIAKTKKIRVLHVVKCFYAGGAERLLSGLLKYSDTNQYEHIILSLSSRNERLRHIEETLPVFYRAIETDGTSHRLRRYRLCYDFIRAARPDVIKCWLPPANIFGGFAGKFLGIPVIWGIHDAQDPRPQPGVIRWQVPLSKWLPKRIIACSQKVYATCRHASLPETLLQVIPNGLDAELFRPQAEGRKRVRKELGLNDQTLLIGMAAEYSAIKRPQYFLEAAEEFLKSYPDTRFMLCGKDMSEENSQLKSMLRSHGLEGTVHLLGIRDDMADIYSALDIHTLTSHSESFGLSVLEAAACGTLNVATDTGIMNELLVNAGFVIPVTDDVGVLVGAWKQAARLGGEEKASRTEAGRQRCFSYSITETARQYDALYGGMTRK